MGEVIDKDAALDDIEADVREAYQKAVARGGDIAAAAEQRLGGAITAIDDANAILDGAREAERVAWTVVLARDEEADATTGSVRDEMWNALGRTPSHPAMNHVFPGGVRTYTSGSPLRQPVLMQVLETRIPTAETAQWTAEMRSGWIARIAAARAALEEAVNAYRPLEAALQVAEAGRRAAIRAAHARLTSFKRDLKSQGLSEAQIHQIIRDRPRSKKKKGSTES